MTVRHKLRILDPITKHLFMGTMIMAGFTSLSLVLAVTANFVCLYLVLQSFVFMFFEDTVTEILDAQIVKNRICSCSFSSI